MTIKGIDLNMKWNDYKSDTLYLWNGKTLFEITEGTGDALTVQDEAEGYKDYWITDWYSLKDKNGGIWLEKQVISDINYTIQDVINRIMECDLWDDNWIVLDPQKGNWLAEGFEDYNSICTRLEWQIEKTNQIMEDK